MSIISKYIDTVESLFLAMLPEQEEREASNLYLDV